MLTCAHVLLADGNDVAQCANNRVAPCDQKSGLHNFVGGAVDVRPQKDADAGIFEGSGAQRTILHIGEFRAPVEPREDLYVMKDGATTGFTFSKILRVNLELKIDEVLNKGLFAIENSCDDNPALAADKYGDPKTNPKAIKPEKAKNKFAYQGDSGALIVVGKDPNTSAFAVDGSRFDNEYKQMAATEKTKVLDKYHRAALGLLIATDVAVNYPETPTSPKITSKVAFGQRIQLALDALSHGGLKVTLDHGP